MRPSTFGLLLPPDGANLCADGPEVLLLAYSLRPTNLARTGVYRTSDAGPVLVIDPLAAPELQRNMFRIWEWTARNGTFAMLNHYHGGRVGFAPEYGSILYYRAGALREIAAGRYPWPGYADSATPGSVHLDSTGNRAFFLERKIVTPTPGASPSDETVIYSWENGTRRVLLDAQTQFAGERVQVGNFAISEDQVIAFHDYARRSIALLSAGSIKEIVPRGVRATDGTPIDWANILRIDGRYVYFTVPRQVLSKTGSLESRTEIILRIPREGGPVEPFFHPDRVFGDTTRFRISDFALTGDAPHLTFRVKEIAGNREAIYRGTAPFGRVPFPAVPTGFPSIALDADASSGLYFNAGYRADIRVNVDGPGAYTFAWFVNGQRVDAAPALTFVANNEKLTLFPFAQQYHAGDYKVAVTNAIGTSVATTKVTVAGNNYADGGTLPVLVNFSVRGYSIGADGVFTAGFSLLPPLVSSYDSRARVVLTPVAGTSNQLLIRAVGPGLAPFTRDDVVPAPATRLGLFSGVQEIGHNDGAWNLDPTVAPAAAAVGAFPLAPDSRDSALVVTLPPQSYTAQAEVPAGNGTVLVECYVVQGRGSLRNLAARGYITDLEPRSLTLGFVNSGRGVRSVLLRGVGPGLQAFGVANAVDRPRLELFSADNSLLALNTGIGSAPNLKDILAAAARFGAFQLAADSADAAMLLHIPEGAYIARLTAAPGSPGGIALIEFYTNAASESRN